MGEYADMAIDDALAYDDYLFDNPEEEDYFAGPVIVRRRKRKPKYRTCSICGKFPLYFEETSPNLWILAEFNDENKLVRHVCKMKHAFVSHM